MRKLFLLLLLFSSYLSSFSQVKVNGYYRKNGTYVQPHYRSSPDGNPYNNYSFPGNTNPYTGKTSTGNPDTYLNNYYNKSSKNNNFSDNNLNNSNRELNNSNLYINSLNNVQLKEELRKKEEQSLNNLIDRYRKIIKIQK